MAPPTAPAPLMEELVEEILLRLPPHEPACLFRAASVCKPWRRLISGPRFRRRYREFHRTPPMLGLFGRSLDTLDCSFVPATPFRSPPADRLHCDVLDARHGRVLLLDRREKALVVWDPITDEQRALPVPPVRPRRATGSSAAVLCAAAGACDHLDCHRGPFQVVYVGVDPSNMFVCTWKSDVAAWSEIIFHPLITGSYHLSSKHGNVLVGNALYFGFPMVDIILKYNLESREMSWIQFPEVSSYWLRHVLTSTEENTLGLITASGRMTVSECKLYMWSRKDAPEVDAGWTQSRVIDLKTLLHVDDVFASADLVGFADGLGVVFMLVKGVHLYTIDLKTYKVELYLDRGMDFVVPYMSFYTPELEAACTGQGTSPCGSSA